MNAQTNIIFKLYSSLEINRMSSNCFAQIIQMYFNEIVQEDVLVTNRDYGLYYCV